MTHGLAANRAQMLQQLLQVLFVGLTLGLFRNVVPALAEQEFGIPRGSFLLLVAFVVVFGVVNALLNLAAGRLAERWGRRRVLLAGWWLALPIPLLIYLAPSWSWIVAATLLLGVQQGLTWSMTQTAKLDMSLASERGFVIGLNEFSGYVGVALAAILTGYGASHWGARQSLLVFGFVVIGSALLLAQFGIRETLPFAQQKASPGSSPAISPSTATLFVHMSWRDRRMFALCQAGLVEKFVDALVWVFWPVWLHAQGLSLPAVGWVLGCYGFTWGVAQLLTARLSDRFGRHRFNVAGMVVCGLGVALLPFGAGTSWWAASAALTGLGMAMLYPNLSAAVADLAPAHWRASAIGIYRFWRDLGYAVGGLALGLAAVWGGQMETAFWFVAAAMVLSAALLALWGEESLRTAP